MTTWSAIEIAMALATWWFTSDGGADAGPVRAAGAHIPTEGAVPVRIVVFDDRTRSAPTHRVVVRGIGGYLTPLLVMTLELYLGMRLYHARHPHLGEHEARSAGPEWLIFALLLARLMPTPAVAMFLAERAGESMPQAVLAQLTLLLLLRARRCAKRWLTHTVDHLQLGSRATADRMRGFRSPRRPKRTRQTGWAASVRGIAAGEERPCAVAANNERWFRVLCEIFPRPSVCRAGGSHARWGPHGRNGERSTYAGVVIEHPAGRGGNGGP